MVLSFSTSALVKRYFYEPYSDEIISRWKSASQIVTSFVAYTETMASMYRKKREADLEGILIRETVDSFQKDWITFIRVEENDELSGYMTQVIKKHPLRGFDEIHLASAMMIHENLPDHFLFACFDERLNYAARSEGLGTFPP